MTNPKGGGALKKADQDRKGKAGRAGTRRTGHCRSAESDAACAVRVHPPARQATSDGPALFADPGMHLRTRLAPQAGAQLAEATQQFSVAGPTTSDSTERFACSKSQSLTLPTQTALPPSPHAPQPMAFSSDRGMMAGGFEEMNGQRYHQGWWFQWSAQITETHVERAARGLYFGRGFPRTGCSIFLAGSLASAGRK